MPTLTWQIQITNPNLTPITSLNGAVQQLTTQTARAAQSVLNLQTAQERLNTAAARTLQAEAQLDRQLTLNATAAQRLAQAEAQTAQAQTQSATAAQRLAAAQSQSDAAQNRAAQSALRLQQTQTQVARSLQATGQAAQQHGSALVGFFQQAASAAAGFLAANVLQQIVGGLTNIGQAAITSAASMEQTRAGFTTLLGSAQQADALIAQLQQEANKSPFELANFRQGAQLLLGMGVAADQIVPRLRNVSNVVAAVGGTPETFNRITLALGQIQAKGKVSAEEINQLAENGVPGWDILAQALGKTRADVIDLAQQGKLSADVWNQAFTQFAQSDRISKAADAQSHTFNGLLSTIRDIGTALGNAFGGPLIAAVEPTLERIVASLQDPQVTATLAQWGAAAGQFVVGLIQAGQVAFQVAGQILGAFKPVTDALGNLFGIKGGPAITLPDFQPVVVGSSTLGTNLTKAADSAKSVKDQIADLERTNRGLNRGLEEGQVTYEHTRDTISEQIRLLQEKYDTENRTTDIARLRAKIAQDEKLATFAYSSQGQAAAERLVNERQQLADALRRQQFENDKGLLEAGQRGKAQEHQAAVEGVQQTIRDNQAKMDALREGQQDAPPLGVIPTPPGGSGPSRAVAGDSIADRYAPPQAPAQVGLLTLALDGLTKQIGVLLGGPSGMLALTDTWNKWVSGFGAAGTALSTLATDIGKLAHALNLDTGLAKGLAVAKFALDEIFHAAIIYGPVLADAIGGAFSLAAHQIDGFVKLATAGADVVNALTGQGDADTAKAALAAAVGQFQSNQREFDAYRQTLQGDVQTANRRFGPVGAADAATFVQNYAAAGAAGKPAPPAYALPPARGGEYTIRLAVTVDQQGRIVTQQQLDAALHPKRIAQALGDYMMP